MSAQRWRSWYDPYSAGVKAFESGDCSSAVESLNQAVAANPRATKRARLDGTRTTTYFPYFYLGQAHLCLKDYPAALANYQKAQTHGRLGNREQNSLRAGLDQANRGLEAAQRLEQELTDLSRKAIGALDSDPSEALRLLKQLEDLSASEFSSRNMERHRRTAKARLILTIEGKLSAARTESTQDEADKRLQEADQRIAVLSQFFPASSDLSIVQRHRQEAGDVIRLAEIEREKAAQLAQQVTDEGTNRPTDSAPTSAAPSGGDASSDDPSEPGVGVDEGSDPTGTTTPVGTGEDQPPASIPPIVDAPQQPSPLARAVVVLYAGSLDQAIQDLEGLRGQAGSDQSYVHAFLGVAYATQAQLATDVQLSRERWLKAEQEFRLARRNSNCRLPSKWVSPVILEAFRRASPEEGS